MRGDFKLRTTIDPAFTWDFVVDLGTATQAEAGEPLKGDDAATTNPWTGEASIMADGEGTTTQRFVGMAKSDSTETAAVAGSVTAYMPLPGIIYSGKALTAAEVDTAAELNTYTGKRVVFDLTSDVWTVDTEATDAVANCVVIVGGDIHTSEVFFVYRNAGSALGFCISA